VVLIPNIYQKCYVFVQRASDECQRARSGWGFSLKNKMMMMMMMMETNFAGTDGDQDKYPSLCSSLFHI